MAFILISAFMPYRLASAEVSGTTAVADPARDTFAATTHTAAPATSAVIPTDTANAGALPTQTQIPFTIQRIATFDRPWSFAFLPDGRLLLAEKGGSLFIVTQDGHRQPVVGIPTVYDHGQTGLHAVAIPPDFAQKHNIYFTYVAPTAGGGVLTLARAQLDDTPGAARLRDLKILWRQQAASRGGHPGARIAFAPDGQHLFLTVGERQESDTAQDPGMARGKILRMTRDGGIPADNPWVSEGGLRALTWTTGHRNPYGLALAPDGRLWEHEMGPRGGDELNLIRPGLNYGWPIVSDGDNYTGWPIPDHSTRPEFQAPVLTWTPVIAPSGMAFYDGKMFPGWQGSLLISGLMSQGLVRVVVDGLQARQADRWSLGKRIRDVAVSPDGAVWVIEDGKDAGLLRLTPEALSSAGTAGVTGQ